MDYKRKRANARHGMMDIGSLRSPHKGGRNPGKLPPWGERPIEGARPSPQIAPRRHRRSHQNACQIAGKKRFARGAGTGRRWQSRRRPTQAAQPGWMREHLEGRGYRRRRERHRIEPKAPHLSKTTNLIGDRPRAGSSPCGKNPRPSLTVL